MSFKEFTNKQFKSNFKPGISNVTFKQFVIEKDEGKEDGEDKVMGSIIEFFSTRDKPSDDDIHGLAESLGIDKHKFEEKIYAILSSFFNAGRHKESPSESIDDEELKKGIKVEMEHTTSPEIARRISLDHLAELPDYYTRLAKMEG